MRWTLAIWASLSLLAGGSAIAQSRPAGNALSPASACDVLERVASPDGGTLHDLATCFFRGEGRAQDYPRARALYAQAIERGFVRSMCALGNMMVDGLGGVRDVAGGLALCRRAAETGDAQAQTDLANYLLMGRVVPRDVGEARRLYALAAAQGQANAAFVLGQIYWNGDGVAKDNAEAARWWRVAHEGGRRDAAYLLAREAFVRLSRSATRPEDANRAMIEEAIGWYEIAAQNDAAPAQQQDSRNQIAFLRQFQAQLLQRRGQ
jgi:uncharacterized protein